MADYKIGDKVIKIDSGEHGIVIEVMPARRGRQLYQVVFPSGEERVLEADLRAGFKQCYVDKDFATIVMVGDRIPQNLRDEDEVLLQFYDIALNKT